MIPQIDCSKITLKDEKAFQSFLTERLRKNKWFVAKFSDQAMGYKPYDFVCEYKHGCFHVELKYQYAYEKYFSKEKIRPNQHAALRLISEYRPEGALVCVYVEKDKQYYTFTYSHLMEVMKNKKTIDLKTINMPE